MYDIIYIKMDWIERIYKTYHGVYEIYKFNRVKGVLYGLQISHPYTLTF